jgi:hypothetical protein
LFDYIKCAPESVIAIPLCVVIEYSFVIASEAWQSGVRPYSFHPLSS